MVSSSSHWVGFLTLTVVLFPWVAACLINLISPGPQPFPRPSSCVNKGAGGHFRASFSSPSGVALPLSCSQNNGFNSPCEMCLSLLLGSRNFYPLGSTLKSCQLPPGNHHSLRTHCCCPERLTEGAGANSGTLESPLSHSPQILGTSGIVSGMLWPPWSLSRTCPHRHKHRLRHVGPCSNILLIIHLKNVAGAYPLKDEYFTRKST